jgi:hypothetical protein
MCQLKQVLILQNHAARAEVKIQFNRVYDSVVPVLRKEYYGSHTKSYEKKFVEFEDVYSAAQDVIL